MVIQRSVRNEKSCRLCPSICRSDCTNVVGEIPAMEDYLNHLGRMYILTTAGTSDANPYYQVSWALYPDLAMDLIVPQLARFMDVETAGKLFFITAQLLIVTGAIALELSVKRRHRNFRIRGLVGALLPAIFAWARKF